MIPENLLAEAYRNPEMHLVIMEYATWLKDPVAFSLVYHSLISRGHVCYFVAPVGMETVVTPPGVLFSAKEGTMREWMTSRMGFLPPYIWIGES